MRPANRSKQPNIFIPSKRPSSAATRDPRLLAGARAEAQARQSTQTAPQDTQGPHVFPGSHDSPAVAQLRPPAVLGLRGPSQKYWDAGANGFLRELPEVAKPDEEIDDAMLEQYEFAQHILQHGGSNCPSLDEMIELNKRANTSSSLEDRIAALEVQHTHNLKTLCDRQADQWLDDALDRYVLRDPQEWLTLPHGALEDEARAAVGSLTIDPYYFPPHNHTGARGTARDDMNSAASSIMPPSTTISLPSFDDQIDALRWAHNKQLIRLRRKLALATQAENANFPLTTEAWRALAMDNPRMHLRVARFLTGDKGERSQMVNENGWAWRQTDPLHLLFTSDILFKREVLDVVRANADVGSSNAGNAATGVTGIAPSYAPGDPRARSQASFSMSPA